ncbi:hypothetical protein [Larkinella rosea]|uniref:Glycosyltransferase RgtA/B/C/D-like domain-containing protein n=1 Tax=Larkinella rosea TaxID=2025312 RepID=A0A3P1C135_9BACT|nr:hypothetical protein [Larkinella rosea]RRB07131.1 hypothetical protein EHT25_04940 [Larkinella rosea]
MLAFRKTITVFLLLTPLVIVCTTVFNYAIDLPYWDDYIVHSHLISLKSDTGIFRKLGRLFDQHWEHRIVWTRSLFFLYYKLTGQLNYYNLTLVGFSGLVLLVAILYGAFRKTRLPLFYFLPVPFLLLNLQSHENLIWAMASIQNFYILVFALGAFYMLAYPTRRAFGVALLLAVLGSFTSGNGFLIFMIGAFLLFWQHQYRRGICWLLVGLGCVIAYFFNYNRVTFFPSPYLFGYLEWVKAFFVFAGAFVDTYPYTKPVAIGYENPVWLTVTLGLLVIGFASWFLLHLLRITFPSRRRSTQKDPWFWPVFFLGSLLFLLATDAMTVYSRVGFGGASYMLQSRYKIYSGLLLSISYLGALWRFKNENQLPYIWGICLLSIIPISLYADYQCLEGVINQRRKTVAAYLTWRLQTPMNEQQSFESVYHPHPYLDPYLSAVQATPTDSTAKFDQVNEEHFFLKIAKTKAINPTLDRPEEGSYIVLLGDSTSYIYPARPLRPYSVQEMAAKSGKSGYFSSAFQALVPKETTVTGLYRLALLTNRNDSLRLELSPAVFRHTTTF